MSNDAYRTKIDRLIREMSGEVALNGSHAHAAIIIERMFASADSCVRILSRTFDPRIYGATETVAQANLFLGLNDRRARILVEELEGLDPKSHPFLANLGHFKNVEIRKVANNLRDSIQINFATMDDKGLRFEKDSSESSAIALFGDRNFTKRLTDLFDAVWQTSESIDLKALEVV